MAKLPEHKVYEFGEFRLDAGELMLYRRSDEVALGPKAIETLIALVERRGRIVSKDELLETIWPDVVVEESNLFFYLSLIRKTLGTKPDGSNWIETHRRRGYRFNGDVCRAESKNGANGSNGNVLTRPGPERITFSPPVTSDSTVGVNGEQNAVEDEVNPTKPIGTLRKRTAFAIVAIAALAVSALAYFYLTARPRIDSMAVVPFTNESGDAELEYMASDMAETLSDRLSKVPGLQVKASSAVARHRGSTDVRAIGNDLQVQAVLFGTIDKRGDYLVMRVELVDARTEARIWSETYNKKYSDQIEVQGSIARDLVRRLSLRLSSSDEQSFAKNATENVEAYRLFLKGRSHIRRLRKTEIEHGIGYLQRAIDTDPSYALAYAELANAYRSLGLAGEVHPDASLREAKSAAENAVKLDDLLAESHGATGAVYYSYDWNWEAAEQHFLKALELDPDNSTANFLYADFLFRMGRRKGANKHIQRALELDTTSPYIGSFAAGFGNGKPEENLERARAAINLDPDFYFGHLIAGGILFRMKMYPEAIAEYKLATQLEPDQTWSEVGLAGVYAAMDNPRGARAILEDLLKRSESVWVPPFNVALVYSILGEKDLALTWLERGFEQRDPRMAFLKTDTRLKNLSSEPRFASLMARMQFPD